MTDAEETGDPEPIEFGTVWILGALVVLAIVLGLVCWCLGQCVGNTDRSGTSSDPCCGLQGCKVVLRLVVENAPLLLQQGRHRVADAVAIAADELVDDKPRRLGAYDSVECGDCWGTSRAGFAAAGRRKEAPTRRGMPPPVAQPIAESDDKPAAPVAQPSTARRAAIRSDADAERRKRGIRTRRTPRSWRCASAEQSFHNFIL